MAVGGAVGVLVGTSVGVLVGTSGGGSVGVLVGTSVGVAVGTSGGGSVAVAVGTSGGGAVGVLLSASAGSCTISGVVSPAIGSGTATSAGSFIERNAIQDPIPLATTKSIATPNTATITCATLLGHCRAAGVLLCTDDPQVGQKRT